MTTAALSDEQRIRLLAPPAGPVRMVLDTDTYNEIDDQFALAYTLLSPERLALEAIYAAPFHNNRSAGPADGMRRSYDEILRVLERLGRPEAAPVHRGATAWLPERGLPERSAAVDDLIARAMAPGDGPLYVVAIGAITNVAAAILLEPAIIGRVVVVWLGGHPTAWHDTTEFNLKQDMRASQLIMDCGAPLVRVPCINVTEHLRTTTAELERFVRGRGPIGDYLSQIFEEYRPEHYARSKELWDLGPVAWLVEPAWCESALVHTPILTAARTWSHDPRRHLSREVLRVDRDAIFADLFRKLERAGAAAA
jgi:inosine-uridine nucleoside N-ribohydrolase